MFAAELGNAGDSNSPEQVRKSLDSGVDWGIFRMRFADRVNSVKWIIISKDKLFMCHCGALRKASRLVTRQQ